MSGCSVWSQSPSYSLNPYPNFNYFFTSNAGTINLQTSTVLPIISSSLNNQASCTSTLDVRLAQFSNFGTQMYIVTMVVGRGSTSLSYTYNVGPNQCHDFSDVMVGAPSITSMTMQMFPASTYDRPSYAIACNIDRQDVCLHFHLVVVHRSITGSFAYGVALYCPPAITPAPVNPCANVNCGSHGSCSAGACVCTGGWTGTLCQTAPASKYRAS